MKYLVVSVDTEEEGLWGGEYRITGNTTENLKGLDRFQSICERLGVAPTYLIDAPVLDDLAAVQKLSRWQSQGVCEVGSHCHPWCNPPLASQPPNSAETFLCNLPEELQYQKLQWLTNRIADRIGRAPTSYRAGRYGFNATSAKILDELGYCVDSSILPIHDYRDTGGPNFLMESREPRRYFGTDPDRKLVEIPVTAGFAAGGFAFQRRLWIKLRTPPWTRFRAAGIADQVGIARRVKLSPEGSRVRDLRGLVDGCYRDGLKTLVLMLHSSSLSAGYSPYAPNEEKLGEVFKTLSEVIRYATNQYGFIPATLTQTARDLYPI